MRHPFQCIAALERSRLVAACGSQLLVYDLQTHHILSEWSSNANSLHATSKNSVDDGTERPTKKQKANGSSEVSNIIKLAIATNQRYIVAVTDDKAVRVFEFVENKLHELSSRMMPKRPCAIQISPDGATILCADKFGDVYSIPLLYTEAADSAESAVPQQSPDSLTNPQFKPSASTLTVHSKRNRQALEAQMNQKNFTARKEPLTFEHELLLGHVSMLTDMKYIQDPSDGGKAYILTADRDEHIRISRAPPQAHIIEGFCLGHTSFISKLCQLENTDLLVSGGGDTWLGVWQWPTFEHRNRIDLLQHVRKIPSHESDDRLAVSGIWSISEGLNEDGSQEPSILVACEKVEAVFMIKQSALVASVAQQKNLPSVQIITLPGYPLDFTVTKETAIVSLDMRDGKVEDSRIRPLWPTRTSTTEDSMADVESRRDYDTEVNANQTLKTLNEYDSSQEISSKELDGLLYGVADLRKRGHQEPEEGDDETNAE